MCIILVGKIGKDLHFEAKRQNPDGFSMFTKEQGLIKAPTAAQVAKGVEQFGIWHYRIRSSGKVDRENIHPFPVAGGKAYLYHNGVLYPAKGNKSDTRCFAETLYNSPIGTVRSVLRATSTGQRFLLVSATDPTDYLLFGDWKVGDNGVLMSHTMYSVGARVSYAARAGWSRDPDEDGVYYLDGGSR